MHVTIFQWNPTLLVVRIPCDFVRKLNIIISRHKHDALSFFFDFFFLCGSATRPAARRMFVGDITALNFLCYDWFMVIDDLVFRWLLQKKKTLQVEKLSSSRTEFLEAWISRQQPKNIGNHFLACVVWITYFAWPFIAYMFFSWLRYEIKGKVWVFNISFYYFGSPSATSNPPVVIDQPFFHVKPSRKEN